MIKLNCVECGRAHKARADKFPEMRLENRTVTVVDPITKKNVFKQILIGYVCKKCVIKQRRNNESRRVG